MKDTRQKTKLAVGILLLSGLAVAIIGVSAIAAPDPVATKMQGADTNGNPVQVTVYPAGVVGSLQTPISNTATGAAGAITATLPGTAGKTTFCSGFTVTGGGATGASVVVVTVTGVIGGTMSFDVAVPAGATLGIVPLTVNFNPPLAANAANVSIVVNVPSLGAGNTNSAAVAWGFQQ